MGTMASCFGTRSSNHTHDGITNLLGYISGDLNNNSLSFLEMICSKNPVALDKIVLKSKKLGLNIKSHDIDLIINVLNQQMNLPENILKTIGTHLIDKRMDSIANVLHMFSEKLEDNLADSDPLKAILYLINNLNIFANNNAEEQFLRSTITMMLNFNNKEIALDGLHDRGKSIPSDSAKWLKSLLCISKKSSLIKLIDFIAIRLQLTNSYISGDIRNMELTELFFLFEEMAIYSDIEISKAENQVLLKNINAILLITIMSKKNPDAFLDLVERSLTYKDLDILGLVQKYSDNSQSLDDFFTSNEFNVYFRSSKKTDKTNRHVFVTSFSSHFHAAINDGYDSESSIAIISGFIDKCNNLSNKMSDDEYSSWLNTLEFDSNLLSIIESNLFDELEKRAERRARQISGLGFIANKLVAMGFSPKALSVTNTGVFQPLITAMTLDVDFKNYQGLKRYYSKLNCKQKNDLAKYLFLSLLIRYRMNPSKLENQPKAPYKRQADTSYPIPTLHNISARNNFKTIKTLRKPPVYKGMLFRDYSNQQSPEKVTFRSSIIT